MASGDVLGAAKGDGQMREIATDAGLFPLCVAGRLGGSPEAVAVGQVVVDIVADRLHPRPAQLRRPEEPQRLGGVRVRGTISDWRSGTAASPAAGRRRRAAARSSRTRRVGLRPRPCSRTRAPAAPSARAAASAGCQNCRGRSPSAGRGPCSPNPHQRAVPRRRSAAALRHDAACQPSCL